MILGKQKLEAVITPPQIPFPRRSGPNLTESGRPYSGGLMPTLDSLLPDLTIQAELPNFEVVLTQDLQIEDADQRAISSIGLDLRISDEIYQAPCLRTINSLDQLRKLAKDGSIKKVDPKNGKVILEADESGNKIYYIMSRERITLPPNLNMLVDARSNTGRLAIMCTDRPTIDRIDTKSPVIIAVQPYAFPIELQTGEDSLVQAIFRYKETDFMTINEVKRDRAVEFIDQDGTSLNGKMQFNRYGAELTFHTDIVLIAKPLDLIPCSIALAKSKHYEIKDFFEIQEDKKEIELAPRRFYLLGTRENIRLDNVCGLLSRETTETGTGLWSHFAGFFWPGYEGSITMECRSESPRVISPGDSAGFVLFDKMDCPLKIEKAYNGIFQYQRAPRAPKPFKELV